MHGKEFRKALFIVRGYLEAVPCVTPTERRIGPPPTIWVWPSDWRMCSRPWWTWRRARSSARACGMKSSAIRRGRPRPDCRPGRPRSILPTGPPATRAWADCLAGRAPVYQAEYQVRRHDGRWVWIKVVGKVVEEDAAGRPLRLAVAIRNIDDLRQAEQALRERERRARLALGAPSGAGLSGLGRRSLDRPVRQQGYRRADRLPGRRVHFAPAQLRRYYVARGPAGDT